MGDKSKDPKLCWLCGKKGVPATGSRLMCPKCDVTWMPYGR
jgi:uncharacterized membrane protein